MKKIVVCIKSNNFVANSPFFTLVCFIDLVGFFCLVLLFNKVLCKKGYWAVCKAKVRLNTQ
jgi:hypothetical protein